MTGTKELSHDPNQLTNYVNNIYFFIWGEIRGAQELSHDPPQLTNYVNNIFFYLFGGK